MPLSQRCLATLLLVCLLAFPASGDYIVSVGTPGGTNVNLGLPGANQSIDFFLGEDRGGEATQPISGIVATFSLAGGLVGGPIVPSGSETASNETGTLSRTGSVGTEGFFGAGNLDTSTIFKATDSSFQVNQFFSNLSQPVEDFTSPERWFSLNLDTTGLSPGDYAITLESPDNSFRNSLNQPVATRSNLSFTVTAIPEPGSVAALAILGTGGLLVRRFRSRK